MSYPRRAISGTLGSISTSTPLESPERNDGMLSAVVLGMLTTIGNTLAVAVLLTGLQGCAVHDEEFTGAPDRQDEASDLYGDEIAQARAKVVEKAGHEDIRLIEVDFYRGDVGFADSYFYDPAGDETCIWSYRQGSDEARAVSRLSYFSPSDSNMPLGYIECVGDAGPQEISNPRCSAASRLEVLVEAYDGDPEALTTYQQGRWWNWAATDENLNFLSVADDC